MKQKREQQDKENYKDERQDLKHQWFALSPEHSQKGLKYLY